MSIRVFKKLPSSLQKAREKGYQFAPLRMIFDGIVELRIKARLVIGEHVVNSSGNKVYASTMKLVSARNLMTISAQKNLEVMKGYIGNDCLNVKTEDKIYTHAGAEFDLLVIMSEGTLLKVVEEFYVLPTSGNRRQAHLSHTLREM